MEVNFFSPVILTNMVLPIFLNKRGGLIININSLAGKQGSSGEAAYCASKQALNRHFDSLKFDIISKGVRILNVELGAMNTQMIKNRKDPEKIIQPEEVARCIVKNCEEYNSFYIGNINITRRKY
jgi:short-subunit dehydrogenase